ncbi:MAG TPA: L-threonylcarbamoyladenylate synthase [Steroidobacteraceae bacterium]|nr:L-threonylcarbamoyladenylate synthase [Steroidobacteraceae bacterium]
MAKKILRASQAEIEAAVQALRDGDVVAFPTETVYGLGANANHVSAVRKVYELKQRPLTHPLIVHIDHRRFLHRWAHEVPEVAEKLAERFWPGPLTIVLPRAANVPDIITGGQDTVAIRVPSHPMAQQLLTAFGGGIAAPSANRFGRLSATRAEHVREEFGDAVRVVLDGGESQVGLESTIVSCLDGKVRLLRPGAVTLEMLRSVAGEVELAGADEHVPRVPGSLASHYAPQTPLQLVLADELEATAEQLTSDQRRIAVLAQRPPLRTYPSVTWINAGSRVDAYAHDLYVNLRTLDKTGCAHILVQRVPDTPAWDAVRDRLQRAATTYDIEVVEEDG